MTDNYGKELVLDLHGCNATLFTRKHLRRFFIDLCTLIDMQPEELAFWDDYGLPLAERQTEPHLKGTSAVQFILTSSITIHALDLLQAVYLNIFSCKDFDTRQATNFVTAFFEASRFTSRILERV